MVKLSRTIFIFLGLSFFNGFSTSALTAESAFLAALFAVESGAVIVFSAVAGVCATGAGMAGGDFSFAAGFAFFVMIHPYKIMS